MKPSCVPFSGEISGRTAVIIPIPTNETDATASSTNAAKKSAFGMFRPKNAAIATISPATYALRGMRAAILDGAGVGAVWGDIWPLIVIGVISIPLGIWAFRRGELHAKKTGKLKRAG